MSSYKRVFDGRIGISEFRNPPSIAKRVIWFPFGGGTSRSFAPVASHLPPHWAVMAVDPPGHLLTCGDALRDPISLCDLYLKWIGSSVFEGAILSGHSVGGLIAAYLVKCLEDRDIKVGGCIIAAARPPGHNRDSMLSTFSQTQLFEWWRQNVGHDAPVEGEWDLFLLLEPSIRADIALYEAFDEIDISTKLTPTLLLSGVDDVVASPYQMAEWRTRMADVSQQSVPGHHLFILEYPCDTAQSIMTWGSMRGSCQVSEIEVTARFARNRTLRACQEIGESGALT